MAMAPVTIVTPDLTVTLQFKKKRRELRLKKMSTSIFNIFRMAGEVLD